MIYFWGLTSQSPCLQRDVSARERTPVGRNFRGLPLRRLSYSCRGFGTKNPRNQLNHYS